MSLELPPLSLYVHLPWCVRKCPYCDFNSHRRSAGVPEADYVDALLRDLDAERPYLAGRPLISIFVGGGTPSLFSAAAIARLLEGIRAGVRLADDVEITLEANPGAAEAERFAGYRRAGVNRLSIGLQSLRNAQLTALGRVHDAREAVGAVEAAKRAGFANFNVDLMYGLPDDDVDGALGDLCAAIGLGPTHISWYQLTLEPGTPFYRRPPRLPAEGVVLDIEEQGRELLAAHRYDRYEISAYARAGSRSIHNLNYWQFGDYAGIGAGAHGKLTLPEDGRIVRRVRQRSPRRYMAGAGTAEAVATESIDSARQRTVEFMMNALRLVDGFEVDSFRRRTGQPAAVIDAALAEAASRGWIGVEREWLRPSEAGLRLLNPLLALF